MLLAFAGIKIMGEELKGLKIRSQEYAEEVPLVIESQSQEVSKMQRCDIRFEFFQFVKTRICLTENACSTPMKYTLLWQNPLGNHPSTC